MLLMLCSCANGPDDYDAKTEASPAHLSDCAVITFNFEKQSGHASNQFAVWIEDIDGNLMQTLYATRFTANGGYKNRPDSIPTWVEKSNLASMSKSEADAITGATPKSGELSYVWDLSDLTGNTVSHGEYRYFVEGSLRWKNRVLYTGIITVGDSPAATEPDVQFFYEASDNQPALTADSPEISMISDVGVAFK